MPHHHESQPTPFPSYACTFVFLHIATAVNLVVTHPMTTESSSSTDRPWPPTSSFWARAQSQPLTCHSAPAQRSVSVHRVIVRTSCYIGSLVGKRGHLLGLVRAGDSVAMLGQALESATPGSLKLRDSTREVLRRMVDRGARLRG
jgi:hypothetical protein